MARDLAVRNASGDLKVDVFAFGVLLWELATRSPRDVARVDRRRRVLVGGRRQVLARRRVEVLLRRAAVAERRQMRLLLVRELVRALRRDRRVRLRVKDVSARLLRSPTPACARRSCRRRAR